MKFRKKPVIVEAEQFFADKKLWPEGVYDRRGGSLIASTIPYWIKTIGGEYQVVDGDWIITRIKGEKYLCKPDIFEQTYEPVVD